jgi:Ca-activated chloride channel family protein
MIHSRALPRRCLLPSLLLAVSAGVAGGCTVFVKHQQPVTPQLQNLSEEQVFAIAPAPEWPQPQMDSAATATVDISCGVGPRTSTGLLYAAVAVKGRPATGVVAPLNISLVLDRSGSMAGEPFRNMLLAAEAFIGQLRDGDRLSVVAFSDGVWEAVPPTVINGATRNAAVAGVRALRDGGGTYLSGGMLAGLAEVFGAFQPWIINQVVLFSDGQPTAGITSASELARIASRAAERGVSITTIGFGTAHDELLMQGIADASGGTYYYVDSPDDMPRIFQREAGAILRSAGRGTDVDLEIPAGLVLEDVIGYGYVVAGGHVHVRIGSVPHNEERYVVFRFRPAGGGTLPVGVVYSDLGRRGRFGVSCAPGYDPARGGEDRWALELAGRAEAAWGLQEAMAWSDSGSEVFVISQLGYTRGIIATLRENLGPQALTAEDNMLLGAQAELGLKVASGASGSFLSGGVKGLTRFATDTAVTNATTAVAYKVDQSFRPRARVGFQVHYMGGSGMRFAAHGTHYKPRDNDGSLRFKRARFKSYTMMRTRGN